MFLRSWKRLTDKVYMLGGLQEKEKPRPFVIDLLKEGARTLLQQTGSIESTYIIQGANSPSTLTNSSQILLPEWVGTIKSVQCNGTRLNRFHSGHISMDGSIALQDGQPQAWNMAGDKVVQLDAKLSSDDYIVITFDATEPQEDLTLKGFKLIGNSGSGLATLDIEPHADTEFGAYWQGKTLKVSYVTPGSLHTSENFAGATYNSNYRIIQEQLRPSNDSNINKSDQYIHTYTPGKYQRIYGSSDGGHTQTRVVDSVVFQNYRTNYGPTCKKEYQDYLPYYALSVILQAEDSTLAGFYNDKFFSVVGEVQDRNLDNDLTNQIVSESRNEWRNL